MASQLKASSSSASKKLELVDLNEYCLIKSFRKLSLRDLNAVNATCHKFHDIVVYHVYRQYSSITNFDIDAMGKRYELMATSYNVERIKGYLERFGHFIRKIKFDKKFLAHQDNKIFIYIVNYFSKALKSPKMVGVNLKSNEISMGRQIYENLTKLNVDCHLNWSEVFPLCVNLEELCSFIQPNDDRPLALPFNIHCNVAAYYQYIDQLQFLSTLSAN